MSLPTITYWKGRPLNEVPREELEFEFIAAQLEIAYLRDLYMKISCREINYLKELAISKRKRWWQR